MQELFRSFAGILNELEPNGEVREALVFAAWRRAAGELLSERSCPVEFSKKRLVIAVADEMWRKQMTDLSEQMMFKLNSALGTGIVTFIEFRVDKKAVFQKRAKLMRIPTQETAPFEATNPDLMKAASRIKSKSMRTQFLNTANAVLSSPKP